MRAARLLLFLACAGCTDVAVGCGVEPAPSGESDAGRFAAHGDHSPHHGGVVMMKGDLHYEVVLDPAGRYRIYFSDAVRADLPAATATNAAITVVRPDSAPEGIELRIDETGESWIGEGRPVVNPQKTTARISYTIRGEEPYWIDLPFVPPPEPSTDPHTRPPGT